MMRVRTLRMSDITRCPIKSLSMTHYDDDGTCLCGKEVAMPDVHGNTIAREGCDRCACGSKYWEHDRCVDCGTHVRDIPRD